MIGSVARATMAVAIRCLGDHHRHWALAMAAEYEVAADDGRPLRFAAGCLAVALHEMPAHEEGRFTLASYAFTLGLLIPMAALLITGVLLGFPYLSPGHAGVYGLLMGSGGREVPFTDAYWAAVPSLALLVLLLGVGHLLIAWVLLERDWARVIVIGKFNAAVAVTLVAFTGVLFLGDVRALLQAAALAVELTAVSGLAWWHDRLSRGISSP